MWRAMLNPNWGMVNYVLGQLGLPQPLWLADSSLALFTLVVVDSWQWTPFIMVIVFARLQVLPRDVFEAASTDGAGARQTLWRITLPLLVPAIVFAGIFRAIDAFRSFDIVFGLTYGGPGRLTTTLSFYGWENGHSFFRYGYSSAISYVMVVVAIVMITLLFRYVRVAPRGRRMRGRPIGRAVAYVMLVIVAVIGFAPFVLLVIYSTKSRIEILQVPPTLDFDIDQIVKNYRDVLVTRGFLGFIENSIIVTGATVAVSLAIATPAAYAFSRLRFRRRDGWASTILSFRFMPPIAVAIPILLMMQAIDFENTVSRVW